MANTNSFGDELNQQQLRIIQIMVGALMFGVLLFAGFVILMLAGVVDMVSDTAPRFDHNIFAVIIVIATLAGMFSSSIVPDRFMTNLYRDASGTMRENPKYSVLKQIGAIRGGLVLKFAILESVALMGLIFNILAAIDGYGLDSWRVWLNFLPSILLLLRARAEFPTRERILETHRNYSQLV